MFVPWYFWGESAWNAYFICSIMRYVAVLNVTWCVNSVAHLYGNKPYDKTINPVENLFVAFTAIGEGYHNYHHTFPYDYSTSEHGWRVNVSTFFIDLMAKLGLAYDRRKMSTETVLHRRQRTGDGSEGFGYLAKSK
jgi:stearoyl-CoA desaturase (delta-9 desaturase)